MYKIAESVIWNYNFHVHIIRKRRYPLPLSQIKGYTLLFYYICIFSDIGYYYNYIYHILSSDNHDFAYLITLEMFNRYWPFYGIWLCGSGKSILPGADIGYQPWYWVLPWRHQELCASLPTIRWRLIYGDR